ncbi:hypothetical protein [Enterocloster sp.]|uniref:hypothetical protein n=1 Tax=Enterocloster sp. TaxID=2719315 RepID=UPI0039A3BB2F
MSYEPYVTYEYYCDAYKGNVIPMDELDKALKQASRHIDSLTYNRIVGRGFSNLTAFQQETIQEVVCQQADFEYENTDEINTILQSYSINGVGTVRQQLECIYRQGCSHEARCVRPAVPDGSVLPVSEVRL